MAVVAAAIVEGGRLLLVSKRAAPEVFYLPGGKPEAGETAEETLVRELHEELGVVPADLALLGVVADTAALEGVPMRLTVFAATIDQEPRPAAELAHLRWFAADDDHSTTLAPAIRNHVIPLLVGAGRLAGGADSA
ncbi:NUDIX domain-containing protein [Streptomyces sp. SID3343]|uniref:NUDIX hydrolase n=1 Tax=Streptomyces sp. SID3343 TaxID=2690260 RepID=UPI001F334073|nr:NUDIX domain-containing protein [Streptomyces sp. SID3343]